MNQHVRKKPGKSRKPKAETRYRLVTAEALERRAQGLVANGWPRSKWIDFCLDVLRMGLKVGVYEALKTRSKYVYVIGPDDTKFKIRFSNHRPAVGQQLRADSDFYVGVSNGHCTTTADALAEVRKRFPVLV